ncbi:MAG: hypothetical protein QM817_06155 [Archangium sp.]
MNSRLLVVFLAFSGCTGGWLLTDPNGVGAGVHDVVIQQCMGSWSMQSDSMGIFSLNPFDAHSSAIDTQNEALPGRMTVLRVDGVPRFFWTVNYDSTCTVPYDNGNRDVPCDQHGFVLRAAQSGDPSALNGLPLLYAQDLAWVDKGTSWTERCIIESIAFDRP